MSGSTVSGSVDGLNVFTVDGVPDTDGSVGLWARAAAATCFSAASISVVANGGS